MATLPAATPTPGCQPMKTLCYDALEPLEKRIRQVRKDIGYVSLSETLDRKTYENLGRVDFNETSLAPYMLDVEMPEFEEAGELPDLAAEQEDEDPTLRLAEAACRWIREMVANNMHGREEGQFRLFVWRPKGDQAIFTARFGCTDAGYVAPVVPRELVVVPTDPKLVANVEMTPERILAREAVPEGRVWGALGAGHAQLIELTQKTYGHLATLQNLTINNQNTQILRMSKVIEDMAGERVKLIAGVAEDVQTRRTEGEESRVREELGKHFISEIGTFGRVIAQAKFGMSPELIELAELVSSTPELMETMKRPEVRALLREEKNRKELAQMLALAAGVAPSTPAADQSTAA